MTEFKFDLYYIGKCMTQNEKKNISNAAFAVYVVHLSCLFILPLFVHLASIRILLFHSTVNTWKKYGTYNDTFMLVMHALPFSAKGNNLALEPFPISMYGLIHL